MNLCGGGRITPEAGLQYTHVNVQGYSEDGAGALDLNVASQTIDSLRTHLGAKLGQTFHFAGDLKFSPEFRAAWYHECLNPEPPGDDLSQRCPSHWQLHHPDNESAAGLRAVGRS